MTEAHKWVTASEAARLLGKTERTIRRWMDAGKIPVDREGPFMRVDIARLFAAHILTEPGEESTAPDIVILQERIKNLETLVKVLEGERDYLRNALAAALSRQTPAIEAPDSGTLRPEPRRRLVWRWWPPGWMEES